MITDFERTILVKLNGTWQAADAHIVEHLNRDEITFKLNGKVQQLDTKTTKYQKFNRLLSDDIKAELVIQQNLEDLQWIVDYHRRKPIEEAEQRLRNLRMQQILRGQEVNHP